ncbi:hypothetical protein [Shewanella carassii]|uniref:hypothetical protein n=1 Tax=Shewanella carassii TaxID=1987584 RepID=UPI000C1F6E6F|nr:hypothetical protein [Shewanella carassii]
MEHSLPYDPVHKERFWRSAVADIRPETELFRELIPRLPIDTKQQLSSAACCFAPLLKNSNPQYSKPLVFNTLGYCECLLMDRD